MRRSFKVIIIIVTFLIIFGVAMYFKVDSASKRAASEITINNIDLTKVDSGVYLGNYSHGPVKVKVQIVVKDNIIEEIKILEHENGLGNKAERIVGDIIDKQTLEVDIVSGASVSSKSILKAIEVAFEGENN